MLERAELIAKAAAWMQARGWKRQLARKRECEQSLFEHSLIEVDVLLELLPILADGRQYGLPDPRQRTAAMAASWPKTLQNRSFDVRENEQCR